MMAEQQTNENALYREISAIFAGVSIIKRTNTQQPRFIGAKAPGVAQLVALQAALVPRDRSQQKAIWSKQIGFAPIINFLRWVFRRMPRSMSRRDERRLRSISEHLLINMHD